jgi:hypothetical protein
MVKNAAILIIALVVGTLTASSVGVQTVHAQHTLGGQPFILTSSINITSPSNITYSSGLLTLEFTVKSFYDWSKSNITMVYCVDGKNHTIPTQSTRVPIIAEITYPNGTITTGISIQSYYQITGLAALPEMSEGSHYLTVYGKYEFSEQTKPIYDSKTVFFTINDGKPPTISNLSLENKTYSQNALPINFTTDQSTSWIGYSLDAEENVTIAGNTTNTTLAALANGPHTLTIYANDTSGNMGTSQTINFNVSTPPSLSLSYVMVGTAIVIATATAILLRIKVRKEKPSFTHSFNI